MSAFNTARLIYRIRDLVDDAASALRDSEVNWHFRDQGGDPSDRCHICSDLLSLGRPGLVQFETGQELPIHKECFQARDGLSSLGCMLSLKLGVHLVSMSMEGEKASRWGHALCDDFLHAHGSSIGEFVLGHGVSWWDRQRGLASMEDFSRWSRHIFMYERDAPKFKAYGGTIPEWHEDEMSWQEYKRAGKEKPGPFYEELRRLQKNHEQSHGKLKRVRPPWKEVMARTGDHCAMCSEPIDMKSDSSALKYAADHILPLSKDGTNDVVNFQPLHKYCNAAKNSFSGGHIPLAFLMGRWFLEQLVSDTRPGWWNKAASWGVDKF